MTETRQWLEGRRAELGRLAVSAGLLWLVGSVLLALGVGVALGRLGVYRFLPGLVLVGWLGALAVSAWAIFSFRRSANRLRPRVLAREVEQQGGLRHGAIGGVSELPVERLQSALAALADRQAMSYLAEHGGGALARLRRGTRKSMQMSAVVLGGGLLVFFGAGPASGGGTQFWRPVATILGDRGPVALSVDRDEVRRGDSVRVVVSARGQRDATLWSRAPGERWSAQDLDLDTLGQTQLVIGPLDADRFLRAVSGGRVSDTIHVRVLFPAFLSDLQLVARYPSYLDRADEPLAPGPDTLALPIGSWVIVQGRVTLPVDTIEWRSGARAVSLSAEGQLFSGALPVTRSARWQLHVVTEDGGSLDEAPPELNVVAVPDSAPLVSVPVPGADTTAPTTLRQPLVIDARDDYALTAVELVSWRASRVGTTGERVTETVPLPGGAPDRAVLQWVLDLNERGFLPGDTAYFQVRARDNAPEAHIGTSDLFRLWLPSMADLRDAMRQQSAAVSQSADSLMEAQRELARRLQDLAAERERGSNAGQQGTGDDELPFNSVERAQELADDQETALEGTRQLREELQELSESAWSAGITDPEFHKQLQDLQDLLDRAVTDELRERLKELRDAVERLDPEDVREALQRLAESAERMQQQLERSRELFERAALEGEMTTLAADAEELAGRQDEWNDQATGEQSDSALAAQERALAEQADSLAARLEQLAESMQQSGEEQQADQMQASSDQAGQANQHMQQAASQAQQGDRSEAQQSGQSASQSLQPLADRLRQQRDQLRDQWRQEVLDAMDRSLVETAQLAERQQEVMTRLNRGEAGADVRGEQAAVRAGVESVLERLQGASGKNALVSPQLGTALGAAEMQMSEAIDQLQRANPNTRQAGEAAGQALDALNAVAHALLRSRAEVAGAQSGSGLAEAMEQLAQMAEQQGQLSDATSGMLSMLPNGGDQLMQDLRSLAQQQQALADELQRLESQGDVTGADEMAREAEELARQLEAARIDRETVERQERLFRRLLDAGRTLRSDEEDEREERMSETADPTNVAPPPATLQVPAGGPRFRYPTWDELRTLSAEERRLILDYFRRLNDGRSRP